MRNWILICCYNRDIEKPTFFATKEEARAAMIKDFASFIGMTIEEVTEAYLEGQKIDEYTLIGEDYAFCDLNEPIDWKIYNIGWDTL